jgi:hypothetical protein
MGEYRFSISANWQIGAAIIFDGQIVLIIK